MTARIRRIYLPLTLLLLLGNSAVLLGQAEHVRIEHPVYEFLQRMQVRGQISGYSRAMLPLERKLVTGFLAGLDSTRSDLSLSENDLLRRYYDEFVAEDLGTQETDILFKSTGRDIIEKSTSDHEKFLYKWTNEDRSSTFFIEGLASLEYRTKFSGDGNSNVWLGKIGGRIRGTLGGILGYGLTATNGTISGDRELALESPELENNFNFGKMESAYFDNTEAYISGSWSWGNLSLGKEKTIIGSGISSQVTVSTNAPPFDALRFNVHLADIRYTFMHGWLLSNRQALEDGRAYYPPKYIALHRLEADIADVIRLGVFESVIYSHRAIDPAYLNPINFFKSAEHAGDDRDNPMLGIELMSLACRGTQVYGTWLIDDVAFSRLGDDWWGNKFIFQLGALNETLLPNTELAVEYTRIKPYTYTHRFPDNEYTHDGIGIGLALQPNSDEVYLGVKHWIGAKLLLASTFHYQRHGANEYDEDGNIVKNNGGDIQESLDYERDSEIAPFLAGPLEQSRIYTLSLRYEFIRNFYLTGRYRYRYSNFPPSNPLLTDHFFSLDLALAY